MVLQNFQDSLKHLNLDIINVLNEIGEFYPKMNNTKFALSL